MFACPSVYEPFGIINLEAMACETAVVASATGGILEVVVDGETGILVPPGEVEPLREALVALTGPRPRRGHGSRGSAPRRGAVLLDRGRGRDRRPLRKTERAMTVINFFNFPDDSVRAVPRETTGPVEFTYADVVIGLLAGALLGFFVGRVTAPVTPPEPRPRRPTRLPRPLLRRSAATPSAASGAVGGRRGRPGAPRTGLVTTGLSPDAVAWLQAQVDGPTDAGRSDLRLVERALVYADEDLVVPGDLVLS